jgi:2-polyprenyl-3-methyl-5-hydroxy-6-metoxy-1,4-benzoquinol methylase
MHSEELTKTGFVYGESARADGRNVHQRLHALAALCPFPGGLAADLGCGLGAYALELAKQFNRVVGIDILQPNIDYARVTVRGNVQFLCSPLEGTPLEPESLDAAFLIEVLDHVADVPKCLAELSRVLKPGGKAYISVPNALFPLETHPVKIFGRLFHPGMFPFLNWTPFHDRIATARIFKRQSLSRLCESCGFEIVASDYLIAPLEYRLKFMRPILSALGRTPVKPLVSVSVVAALRKAGSAALGSVRNRDCAKDRENVVTALNRIG